MPEQMSHSDQPAWAFACENREDGVEIYTDEQGERLAALAVTRDELSFLMSGLQRLPVNEATAALLQRLGYLQANLDA